MKPPFPAYRRAIIAMLAPILYAQTAAAQTLGQGADVTISYWRVAAAFLVCAALAVAAAFAIKMRTGGGQALSFIKRGRRLQLVESLHLGKQTDLCIVSCDGEEWLMYVSAQGAGLLGSVPLAHKNPDNPEGAA